MTLPHADATFSWLSVKMNFPLDHFASRMRFGSYLVVLIVREVDRRGVYFCIGFDRTCFAARHGAM
jgi:hypothetical protein